MANARTAKNYMSTHVVRFFVRLICAVNSLRSGETTRNTQHATRNTRHGRGVVAPHLTDTEASPHQLPYIAYRTRSTLWSSVQVHMPWKRFIFLTHLAIDF